MKNIFFALSFLCGSLFFGTTEAATVIQQSTVELLKPKLNSDRIEYFFGNYGVDTLEIHSNVFPFSRIANLHSVHDGKKVMRTWQSLIFVLLFHPIY